MEHRRKRVLFVFGVLMVCIGVCIFFLQYQSKKTQTILNLTTEQKLSDFDTLCAILDESYPFWKDIEQAGIDKEAIYSIYRTDIANTDTDIEFFKYIGYFLNEFDGCGHLSVLDGYMYGIYMGTLSESNNMLSGKEKRNIVPLRQVLENPVSLNTYSRLDQSHGGFRSTIGLKREYAIRAVENETRESQITSSVYGDRKAAYIKIDSFELTNYQKDKATLEAFFSGIEDVPNLIIDLRGNRGGSDLYWEDLIAMPNAKDNLISERYFLFNQNEITKDYIAALGIDASEINSLPEPLLSRYEDSFTHYIIDTEKCNAAGNPYNGKIWVLIDDTIYSSSENFVMFCKNTGFATLVGTSTGGDGGIADPILISLPDSGLIIRFSAFYGLNNDGSGNEANGTEPDIVISDNEDALEKCLDLIEG